MENRFTRERVRFHIKNQDTLVIQGWIEDDEEGKEVFSAELDGRALPVEVRVQRGVEVTKKYLRYRTNVSVEYFIEIGLPQEYEAVRRLKVYRGDVGGTCIYSASGAALRKLSRHLNSWMESLRALPDGRYLLRGWYIGCEKAELAVLDGKERVIDAQCELSHRMDIRGEYPEAAFEETHGFELTFEPPKENFLRLAIRGNGKKALYVINCKKMLAGREGLLNLGKKSWMYLRRKGVKQFAKRVSDVVLGADGISYERWRRKYGTTQQALAGQREHRFEQEPLISILVPLYRTPEKFLREMIASVEAQTYRNWELILSDGSGADSPITELLKEYEKKDARIRALHHGRQLRIAENTNEAIAAASGEFLAFGDHDDLLAPDALYECVRVLNERPETELIYTDEDKVDGSGRRYFEPHFKSDYNPELLCSMNYFCHLVVVKRSLQERAGLLDPAFDGAQDYDFVLRCTEQTGESQIAHIPKILYHWRAHQSSTAENPESKRYAFDAGCRAVQSHYDRLGIAAKVSDGEYPGLYRTAFEIQGEPLISILIPNKDHHDDLEKCIRSIEEKSDYRNYEYIIIENNSTEPETFETYQRLEAENPKVHVVYYQEEGGFNYSKINNFGAEHARGEYLLLLNNDTEIISPDCLRQMLGYCQMEEIGIVGARLYYEDDIIQHAGVVLGFGGIAGHAFIGQPRGDNGYFSRIICAQDYSAVTAACMMVKSSVFHAVGGMSPELRVAFNDIDFCMKVRAYGKRIVYNPYAELYHYESRSRGLEDTQEKIERFNREMAQFLDRWGDQVKAGDSYYNPNLTLDKADFSLRT
jgi:GT2 family glycosyltransferase